MKLNKHIIALAIASFTLSGLTGCIEELDPKSTTVTKDQAYNAPGAYDNFVSAITSSLAGQFTYSGTNRNANDFGYPAFFIMRDVEGQDIFQGHLNWFDAWYTWSGHLGPSYAYTQMPWTYYFQWVRNCNTVLDIAGEKPEPAKVHGAGIAHAMRAMFYLDLARMYCPTTYALNKEALTVPKVINGMTKEEWAHNKRMTNKEAFEFILSDLDIAEKQLADYKRTDIYTPDLSVVYGLKARTYLTMEDWANAEKYAKLAQQGYQIMDEAQYTSRETGFNTPNDAWMFGFKYKEEDPNIRDNDGDCSWASMMCLEIDPDKSGCGYAANYGQQMFIDRHLYETIPYSDFRKKCFVDFKIDENCKTAKEKVEALKAYSNYPDWVHGSAYDTPSDIKGVNNVGGLGMKFRVIGGQAGHENQHIGFAVSVPFMRVEEMKLIEIEAVGMQNEARGIAMLTEFAKSRDPKFVYGTHNDAYYNKSTSQFRNEVWWQRRVELWGEGFATFDIKRLNKGVIRSYPKSNHIDLYRWNSEKVPVVMTNVFGLQEMNYNYEMTQNETPQSPEGNSPEFTW